MPHRLQRQIPNSAVPQRNRAKRNNVRERALNALAIADEQGRKPPELSRRHRLGVLDESGSSKRKWSEREVGDFEDSKPQQDKRLRSKHQDSSLHVPDNGSSQGSDGEGNSWRLGYVDEDEDSELDSDEAFAESDEERFEDFTFGGSASRSRSKGRSNDIRKKGDPESRTQMSLNEEDSSNSDGSDDSLDEGAVDLATVLDQGSSEESGIQNFQAEDSDSHSTSDSNSEADVDDDQGLSNLLNFVSNLPETSANKLVNRHPTSDESGIHPEKKAPRVKLTIDDVFTGVSNDMAAFRKARKIMTDSRKQSISSGVPGKLGAPLPKRQQDRLDRVAADKEAKKTLDRWIDTVKQNRRAEHLSFPLSNANETFHNRSQRLRPTSSAAENELESVITSIITESGLGLVAEDDDESKLQELENLQMNRMPLEEVQKRRAELRMQRDLMFREEIRAKRLKKIKSKAYRKIHRKERQKAGLIDNSIFGVTDLSDGERDRMDRRRAEERAGTRHRDSKWARSVKQTGRAAWDGDARAGVEEMARRDEELRRRIRGENGDEQASSISSDASESETDEADDTVRNKLSSMLQQMTKAEDVPHSGKGLASMKFMQNAQAIVKARNDLDTKAIERELNAKDLNSSADSDEEYEIRGRRNFGPHLQSKSSSEPTISSLRKAAEISEFEERQIDSEAEHLVQDEIEEPSRSGDLTATLEVTLPSIQRERHSQRATELITPAEHIRSAVGGRDVLAQTQSNGDQKGAHVRSKRSVLKGSHIKGNSTKDHDQRQWLAHHEEGEEEEEGEGEDNSAIQERLLHQAFGGDNFSQNFEKEKIEIVDADDEKVVDNALPGWGAWTGSGTSRHEQNRNGGKHLTTKQGVRPEDRKDAHLKRVIINEKSVKKNNAFLASTLPFPYTTKDEYERSIRMPLGGEWNTKITTQKNLKPRVLVKPGHVVAPIEKPYV